MDDLQLIAPELAAASISDREIVLDYPRVMEAIRQLQSNGYAVTAWEGWLLYPDGKKGHSALHQGIVPIMPFVSDGAAQYFARVAELVDRTIKESQLRWDQQPEQPGATLYFCLSVEARNENTVEQYMTEYATQSSGQVILREVEESDLSVFFENERDPEGRYMAAFTPRDPDDRTAFDAHWAKIMADEGTTNRTIVVDGQVAGSVASFEWQGKPEVGYWLGKEYWGRGIATQALRQFLDIVRTRPIYANAAADNAGSIRVLEKCGFKRVAMERGFANARGAEIDEVVMELK